MVQPWPVTPMKRIRPCSRASTCGIERAARGQRLLPLVRMVERVQLEKIDAIGAQALQRALDLGPGAGVIALAGLGREEEIVPVAVHPGADAQLGIAIGGGGVDMVDAKLEQQLEDAVGGRLIDPAERGAAEDHAGAEVSGAPEGPLLDRHGASPCQPVAGKTRLGRL